MIRCTKCQTINPDDAIFCSNCKSFLEWTGVPATAAEIEAAAQKDAAEKAAAEQAEADKAAAEADLTSKEAAMTPPLGLPPGGPPGGPQPGFTPLDAGPGSVAPMAPQMPAPLQ